MHKEIKLQRAGGSSAVALPKAMLERFHLERGDTAYVVATEEWILITPFDPTFGRTMALAEGDRRAGGGRVRVMEGVAKGEGSEGGAVWSG